MLQTYENQRFAQEATAAPALGNAARGPFLPTCSECIARTIGICPGYGVKDSHNISRDGARVASKSQSFPSRRQILHQREVADIVPVVCSGWAAAAVSTADGRRQVVSFLLAGDMASINYVFEPCGSRMIEAISPVTCRKFHRADFQAALLRHPAATKIIGKALADERERNDQLNLDLSKRSAESRIARLVVSLVARLARHGNVSGAAFDFPPRQQQVADALGLTAVHVCKIFSRLRAAGLLSLEARHVRILDEKALFELAEQ